MWAHNWFMSLLVSLTTVNTEDTQCRLHSLLVTSGQCEQNDGHQLWITFRQWSNISPGSPSLSSLSTGNSDNTNTQYETTTSTIGIFQFSSSQCPCCLWEMGRLGECDLLRLWPGHHRPGGGYWPFYSEFKHKVSFFLRSLIAREPTASTRARTRKCTTTGDCMNRLRTKRNI